MAETAGLLLEVLQLTEPADRDDLARRVRGMNVRGLSSLVRYEECGLWLYRRLGELGALEGLDPEFRAWLAERARAMVARNLLIDAQVEAVLQLFNERGIPHVLLKGTGRRAAGIYRYADVRELHDVDVLVPDDAARAAWNEMRSRGYRFSADPRLTPTDGVHLVPLTNDQHVSVELHTTTARGLSARVAWQRVSSTAQTVRCGVEETRVPSPTELWWHGLTHALHQGPSAFRLRFFCDVAIIWASGHPIDADSIAHRLRTTEIADRELALRWLGVTGWLSGRTDELDLGDHPPFDLEKALRWRLAVVRRLNVAGRAAGRLIQEGTRADIGWGLGWRLAPRVPGRGALMALRRQAVAGLARVCYHAWSAFSARALRAGRTRDDPNRPRRAASGPFSS